ncbi:unnamed protein product [Nezara viridula]|uniref:Uncharacterized protein n=1 Tax=Nezara viridula TaxID=85310 RepID=A0A9P0MWB2_NEZVI|nr:unnamed protein product [Nezara viridula]
MISSVSYVTLRLADEVETRSRARTQSLEEARGTWPRMPDGYLAVSSRITRYLKISPIRLRKRSETLNPEVANLDTCSMFPLHVPTSCFQSRTVTQSLSIWYSTEPDVSDHPAPSKWIAYIKTFPINSGIPKPAPYLVNYPFLELRELAACSILRGGKRGCPYLQLSGRVVHILALDISIMCGID